MSGTMSGPGVALTTLALADTYVGGIDVAEATCSVEDCGKRATKRGWCDAHYARWRRSGDPVGGVERRSGSPIERALAGLDQAGDCWSWTGVLNDSGYGYFRIGRRLFRVHIVMYEHFLGPVPEGMELDHLCRNRACGRPEHLEAVTHHENMLRGWWATKKECIHGHPYTPENTRIDGRGRRECRTCREGWQRKRLRGKPAPRQCDECGAWFQPSRTSALRCSKPCSWSSWYRRKQAAS